MTYMIATGPCIACARMFSFNPDTVPSTSRVTGRREPICKPCMDAINAAREARGDAPFPIAPDAYEPQEVA